MLAAKKKGEGQFPFGLWISKVYVHLIDDTRSLSGRERRGRGASMGNRSRKEEIFYFGLKNGFFETELCVCVCVCARVRARACPKQ